MERLSSWQTVPLWPLTVPQSSHTHKRFFLGGIGCMTGDSAQYSSSSCKSTLINTLRNGDTMQYIACKITCNILQHLERYPTRCNIAY